MALAAIVSASQHFHAAQTDLITPGSPSEALSRGLHLPRRSVQYGFTRRLRDGKNHIYLVVVQQGPSHYDTGTRTVYWNPTRKGQTTSGGMQSPAMALAHELSHAYHHDMYGALDLGKTGDAYETFTDREVIMNDETCIAMELGEDIRSDHLISPFPASSVTDRSQPPRPKPSFLERLINFLNLFSQQKGCSQ